MNEQLIEIVQKYWEEKKGEEAFPAVYEISEGELGTVWANCFIIEVRNGKFVYEFCGDSVIEAYGQNMAELEVKDDDLYPEAPSLVHKLITVLNSPDPQIYDGAFINLDNLDIKFRKILLPLGEDNKITHILGALIWRQF